MKKIWTILIIIIVLVLLGLAVFNQPKIEESGNTASTSVSTTSVAAASSSASESGMQMNMAPVSATTTQVLNQSVSVAIANYAFSPNNLSVKAGTTVVWTNDDSVAHTVTGDNGGPGSGDIAPGASYSYRFNTPGIYAYHCTIHPGMKGIVVVE